MNRPPVLFFPLLLASALGCPGEIVPGEPIDYLKLAFYPEKWTDGGHHTALVPWEGDEVVVLTLSDAHDPKVMTSFVGHLDAGWKLYSDLCGRSPRRHREFHRKATIAAVPNGVTCGYGCGFVGSTGIEMTSFYGDHYPRLQKDPLAVPHAYYYEMGRNFFTFGGKHDCFTTGFAVFMRYVCMDTRGLTDPDAGTRKVIAEAIGQYEQTELPFLRTFTNADGLGEKQNRLPTSPTDQPVMYASAMLALWKEHGDDWLRAFYRQLATCPDASAKSKDGARQQCFHWFLAASCAAKRDLSATFLTKWRLDLTENQRAALKEFDWTIPDATAGAIARAAM